jgi:hypothetical protein
VRPQRIIAAISCVVALLLTGVSCSESKDSSGATTNLEEVGPQISKLRLEVQQLRQEVRTLREQIALVAPTTEPQALPLETTTTTNGGTTNTSR